MKRPEEQRRDDEAEAAYWDSFSDEQKARWRRQYLWIRGSALVVCLVLLCLLVVSCPGLK